MQAPHLRGQVTGVFAAIKIFSDSLKATGVQTKVCLHITFVIIVIKDYGIEFISVIASPKNMNCRYGN